MEKHLRYYYVYNLMNVFLLKKNQDGLILAIDRLSDNNIKLNQKINEYLVDYKNTRRPATNKTQLKLYYKSIQHIKDNLTTDLAISLLTCRMKQFARWFSYMWNCPSLCHKTFLRLNKRFPYNKTHFLRKRKIWVKK
jgi:hypothetical protein